MINSNDCIKCIEFTQLLADISHKGYLLLSAMAKCNSNLKIERSVLSFVQQNKGLVKDPCEWLYHLVKLFIKEHIECIDSNLIYSLDSFLDFISSLSDDNAKIIKNELLYDLSYSIEDIDDYEDRDFNSLEDFGVDYINSFLSENPYRITTVSSKLFDISTDLLPLIYMDLPSFIYEENGLYLDMERITIINNEASTAFHNTDKYKSSITILTEPSTFSKTLEFDVNSFKEGFYPCYINQLIEAYCKLKL